MKKLAFLFVFSLFWAACSQKSTAPVAEQNKDNKTTPVENSKKATILNDLSDKISGVYETKGKKYTYLLEKSKETKDRYEVIIQLFVKGNDSGTYTTVYKSYLNYLQSNEDLKVQIHYAVKPNSYSWKHFPSSYAQANFTLAERKISYEQIGEGWKEIKASGTAQKKDFAEDKLSLKNAFDVLLRYYIDNYEQTFQK